MFMGLGYEMGMGGMPYRDLEPERLLEYSFLLEAGDDMAKAVVRGPTPGFSRTGVDTGFNRALSLIETPTGEPTFMFDPTVGASRGFQTPGATVNEARNNRADGATVGVIGSGGVAPTDWSVTAGSTGLSREIVGTGTEDGLPYCDIRYFGTATADSTNIIQIAGTAAAALSGEVWTMSAYWRLVGGDLTNVSQPRVEIVERDGGGGFLVSSTTEGTLTSAPLKTQRTSHTRTLNNASTAFVSQKILTTIAVGAVDFTMRVAGAQLEEVPFATPLVLTDPGGSSPRNVFSSSIALPAAFATGPFVWKMKGRTAPGIGSGKFQPIGNLDDGTTVNRVTVRRKDTGDLDVLVLDGGVTQAILALGVIADDTDITVAVRVEASTFAVSLNGGAVVTSGAGSLPTGMTTKRFGRSTVAGEDWEGNIYSDTMYDGTMSDADVEGWASS